jgi:hypothetical protein
MGHVELCLHVYNTLSHGKEHSGAKQAIVLPTEGRHKNIGVRYDRLIHRKEQENVLEYSCTCTGTPVQLSAIPFSIYTLVGASQLIGLKTEVQYCTTDSHNTIIKLLLGTRSVQYPNTVLWIAQQTRIKDSTMYSTVLLTHTVP